MILKNINKVLCGLLLAVVTFSSCKKESESTYEIFKGLTIDFNESIASDEVYLEFDLKRMDTVLKKMDSTIVMSKVIINKVGSTTPLYTINIPTANRFVYSSGVIIHNSPTAVTDSYTVTVFDDKGNQINPATDKKMIVTYPGGQLAVSKPRFFTEKEVAVIDEGTNLYINYSIHSEKTDIKYLWLESFDNGLSTSSKVNFRTLPDGVADARNVSGVIRIKPDRNGGAKYRLFVTDGANDYIGDGYKSLHINVKAGFELAANKFLFAPIPESTKANPDTLSASFYSISKKKTLSYVEAKANPADVDLGVFLLPTGDAIVPYALYFYSPDVGPFLFDNSLLKFNLGTWSSRKSTFMTLAFGEYKYTKEGDSKETTLSSSALFQYTLTSKTAIDNFIAKGSFKSDIVNPGIAVTPGNMFYFVTQGGKYGAVFLNGFAKDYKGKWYANIDVKVQK